MNRSKRIYERSAKKRAEIDLLLQEAGLELAVSQDIARRDVHAMPVLSFTQQRLWFLDQLEPGTFLYNIPMALRLRGKLDVVALQKSLQEIVRRHEALRTTFMATDGDPLQVIAPPAHFVLPSDDFSALPEEQRMREVEDLLLVEARTPFDLAQGPLFRVRLLHLHYATQAAQAAPAEREEQARDEDEHILFLNMHHIVADGWSLDVIFRELRILYAAYTSNRPSPLAELPIQYADYAAWQRQRLQGEELARQMAYWKAQLQDAPTLLEMPTDHPRSSVPTFRGTAYPFVLPQELTQALKTLSHREGTTLFMTLLAAFQILLTRYSGQEDIVIGTPIANRTHAQLEGLIGCFVNFLVLRLRASSDLTLRQVLARARLVALDAYEHQDLPFEKLVEELQPERNLSHSPLFQVIFSLQSTPEGKPEMVGLRLQQVPIELEVTKSDIGFNLAETEQGLEGAVGYSTDLFEADTIARMVGHYVQLLEAMVTNLDQPVADVSLLTSVERQMIGDWNQTDQPYPLDTCLHHLFEQQVARTPHAIAVLTDAEGGDRLTYEQLNSRANQLAHYLRSQGVGPETLVGLCLERSPELLIGLLGILKAGAAYVPLDPQYPAERLAFMLTDAQITLVITTSTVGTGPRACPLPDIANLHTVCLDRDWPLIVGDGQAQGTVPTVENPQSGVLAEHLAYVIYTSGSTGTPKGVAVEHRAIVNRLMWSQQAYPLSERDCVLQIASVSFDIALWELLGPLMAGAQVLLARPGGQQDSAYLADLIARQHVTVAHFVPSLLRVLLQELEIRRDSALRLSVSPLSASRLSAPHQETNNTDERQSLRLVFCGGDAWAPNLLQQFVHVFPATQIVQFYGPTEASISATSWQYAPDSGDEPPIVAPIGTPIANMQVYLLDKTGQPVPIGVPGEIYLGGRGLARGYLHHADLTAERFVFHALTGKGLASSPHQRLYRTGDLARYLRDGNLEFLGRIDQQVKIRGFRVELGEIEVVLTEHAAISEAVVLARTDMSGDMRLVAYVVAAAGEAPGPSELRAHLRAKLPEYMLPFAFVRLDRLPLNANGKVERQALPIPDQSHMDMAEMYVMPRTPTEELLASIWSQVLNPDHVASNNGYASVGGGQAQGTVPTIGNGQGTVPTGKVGVHDNFFALGGHSLLATQVIARIREAFQVDLPLRSLFEASTIAELAQRLDAARQQESRTAALPIERVPRTESLPLAFAQQRIWFMDQLEPGNYFYNIPLAVRLTGRLNTDALEQSLNALVRRHESLRTTFVVRDGEPVQVISPPAALPLPVVDLTLLPEDVCTQAAERLQNEEIMQPFDLATGPLLRARLLRLWASYRGQAPTLRADGAEEAEEEHILLLTMHHIISDGWSASVLFRELSALYTAFSEGQPSPLAELPIQYADYAVWQRQWLQGEVLEGQMNYWREQLAGIPEMLELPIDYPRPPQQTFRGSCHTFVLAEELTQALKLLSQREGGTLFMTLLAAFQILLSRYTRQADIAVGSAIANRTRSELEGLIGFFVNALVFRTDLSGNPTVRQVFRRVREVALNAYAHQDLPFEKLVEELAPQRDLSHNPLYQVIFALQNTPQEKLELGELRLQQADVEFQVTKADIEFTMMETGRCLEGSLGYSTDLFAPDTIARMAGHFTCLLEAMVANPEQHIDDLPLLTEAEREQILVTWNDTHAEYSRELCIHQLFEAQVERTPNAVAVVSAQQQLTYRELNERANQLAHHLRSLGLKPGMRVAVYMQRSLEMLVAAHGILKAGGTYVPLETSFPAARVHWILSSLGTEHIVTLSGQLLALQELEHLPTLQHVICLDDAPSTMFAGNNGGLPVWTRSHLASYPQENPVLWSIPEQVAYIIFTSGSTGTPKGVMVAHRAAINLIQWVNTTFNIGAVDRVLFVTSVCFDLSIYDIFGMLASGGSVRVASESELHDPHLLLRVLCEEEITFWNSAPAPLIQLEPFFPGADTLQNKLRLVFLSGDWIPVKFPDILRATFPGVPIVNLGGATEATVWSNYFSIEEMDPLWVNMPYGKPIQNAHYYILDDHLNPCPIGVTGDMYIGGDCLSLGYVNEPVLTADKYIPNPFVGTGLAPVCGRAPVRGLAPAPEPGSRLYKTGDLGRYWRDGTIEFLGRKDHQVKIRGFRIELGEIETVLEQHPLVRDAVVLAREDTPGDKRLVAYVVPQADVSRDELAFTLLRAHVQAKLPDYMLPSTFLVLERLPLTANGKVDRHALPAPDLGGADLESEYVAPRTSDEGAIATVWAEVLKVERVGIHDNFFALGGHSLLATQVVARLRETFPIDLSLRTFFEAATVADLAELLLKQRVEEVEDDLLAQLLDELEDLP